MSEWHRENPHLAGTSADPWMAHPSHRQASEDAARLMGDPPCECGHRMSFHTKSGPCMDCSCDDFSEA